MTEILRQTPTDETERIVEILSQPKAAELWLTLSHLSEVLSQGGFNQETVAALRELSLRQSVSVSGGDIKEDLEKAYQLFTMVQLLEGVTLPQI